MLLLLIFLMLSMSSDANDVTRDFFGDIFHMRDCHNGSRCDDGGRRAALPVPGRRCYCQCSPSHVTYREDKQQCVKDIKECYMSVFYRPFTVEAIPLVYLPTSGQLVHPDAHLSLSMRRHIEGSLAKCRVTVSQYLTKEGWRTVTRMDSGGGSIFGLFTDGNKTFLQFLGSSQDRKLLQQHLALVRLLCIIPQYPAFETCVAIRIGWVPGLENIEDAPVSSNKANMMVVGLSLGVLALVYIFAVLVYMKIRRQMIAKQKTTNDQEAKLQIRDDASDKTSSLHRMEASSRLELYHSTSLGRQKHTKKGCRDNCDTWSTLSPIVETYNRTWTDRMGHSSEFRAQDFKIQPEFFEPEFMASPPHEVLEYLERLQNSITFARHRMRNCYRYQPTLNGIPEDDYFYQELECKDSQKKEMRTTPDGGSASSVSSIQEEQNDLQKRELPKIPPRKPKRKSKSISSAESVQSSDHEQKEIQKAMNTLNDTLDALEYDMYKQEMLSQASDSENANLSCQNSTSIDFDEFETSSCSSTTTSAVTVLGRKAKGQYDLSKCSQFVEKNLSEDFSEFSNSTYSLVDAMRGLFHDGNKVNNNVSDVSDQSSRSPSQIGSVPQSPDPESTKKLNIRETQNSNKCKPDSDLDENISNKKQLINQEGNSGQFNCKPINENLSSGSNSDMITCYSNYKQNSNFVRKIPKNKWMKSKENRQSSITNSNCSTNFTGKLDINTNSSVMNLIEKVADDNKRPKSRDIHYSSNTSTCMINFVGKMTDDELTKSREDCKKSRSINSSSVTNTHKIDNVDIPEGPSLRKSPSNESMATVATDMSTDSLDSRCPSPNHPSLTPSLMEMWISRLVSTSVPYSKTKRKSKKKLVLPEDEIECWEHVCQKHKNPCVTYSMNISEENLIDKLSHYGSKSIAGCDVAGYFQSLKQDVLKEHLKAWLSNNQIKRKNEISMAYRNDCSHTKPLVSEQENNLVAENGMHLCSNSNDRCSSSGVLNNSGCRSPDSNIIEDSLESPSDNKIGNMYFGEVKETLEKCVKT